MSHFVRSFLRRGLHTTITPPRRVQNRLPLVVAATAAAATYLAWRTTSDSRAIALDSVTKISSSRPSTPRPSHEPTFSTDDHAVLSSQATTSKLESTVAEETRENTTTAESGSQQPAEDSNASGGGAFNPVTGEINWDCPCLGGMAHGPCGPQFREAFSCFVFSEEEPKGINCVDKFKAMQQCFREHPETYGEEIMGDDDEEEETGTASTTTVAASSSDEVKQDRPTDSLSADAAAKTLSTKNAGKASVKEPPPTGPS